MDLYAKILSIASPIIKKKTISFMPQTKVFAWLFTTAQVASSSRLKGNNQLSIYNSMMNHQRSDIIFRVEQSKEFLQIDKNLAIRPLKWHFLKDKMSISLVALVGIKLARNAFSMVKGFSLTYAMSLWEWHNGVVKM